MGSKALLILIAAFFPSCLLGQLKDKSPDNVEINYFKTKKSEFTKDEEGLTEYVNPKESKFNYLIVCSDFDQDAVIKMDDRILFDGYLKTDKRSSRAFSCQVLREKGQNLTIKLTELALYWPRLDIILDHRFSYVYIFYKKENKTGIPWEVRYTNRFPG